MPAYRAGHKSILMTPDPYHTPGYGGFCPQFKYQIGETFGRTTSRLLTDTKVASSGALVLADIHPSEAADLKVAQRAGVIEKRTQSWGDQKLVAKMVPGYTGFIPKSQHYFGKRYAENCIKAISDFETDQTVHNQKILDLRLAEALQSGKMAPSDGQNLPPIRSKHIIPLKPIAKEPKPYICQSTPQHTTSPYYMRNDNPDKRFMSGYTGFVPRSRGLLGMGYPLITHVALNDFTDDTMRLKSFNGKPVDVHRHLPGKVDTVQIYPVETGLVPHYTGHIPGEKFRYGQTFGHSTKDSQPSTRAVPPVSS